jgi:hypothetical protein
MIVIIRYKLLLCNPLTTSSDYPSPDIGARRRKEVTHMLDVVFDDVLPLAPS